MFDFYLLAIFVIEDDKTAVKTTRPVSMLTPKGAEKVIQVTETNVIQVPDQDDTEAFFASTSTPENIEVTVDDFDHIFLESANL